MTIQLTPTKILNRLSAWLDPLVIILWGILLLKYWTTGKLNILIHPNYFGLTIAAGITLLILGGLKCYEVWEIYQRQVVLRQSLGNNPLPIETVKHITLLPPNWGSCLLLAVAIIGLIVTPKTFASQTALERGITESLPVTRLQPQEFKNASKPEARSLIEWVRLVNFNPEPDTYKGQKVKVDGFVIHPPSLGEEYIWVSRFVITCCAADAYPIGLPVKLASGQSRVNFPPDKWVEIQGEMSTEVLDGKRKLVIQSSQIKPIPEPKNPYNY